MQADPCKADPPKRKRRWFQFSLRTLLVVVTIVAVQCAVCLPMLREREESQKNQERTRMIVQRAMNWLAQHQGSNSRF